jgi:hypothetical protein
MVGAGPGDLCVRDARLTETSRQAIADGDEVVILNLVPGLYELERLPHGHRKLIQVQPAANGHVEDLSRA